jgi:hypothetical protein
MATYLKNKARRHGSSLTKSVDRIDPTSEFMYLVKVIWLTIVNVAKQVWLLPHNIALTLQQRREQITRREFETERLDRIRNPSKYAGR